MRTEVRSTSETLGLELNRSRHLNLAELIPWFSDEYSLYELINDFWGINCKARLVAVTRDIKDKAWKGLVSEWDTGTALAGQFRVNKALIQSLLKYSLGDNGKPFRLKQITNLELAIFENFFVQLENFWSDYWRLSIPESNGTFVYLIWCIEINDEEIGSLAIGVPPGLVPKKTVEKPRYDLRAIAASLDIEVPLDLTAGKSKLKISEIKGLEQGDLIIFENSSINYLVWDKSDLEKMYINLEIPGKDNSIAANLYYDELEIDHMAEEDNHNNEDLLTDLPVELTAQFKAVHMPLSKIIELESGGILPLGLLIDSQLTLVAPGDKPIASGNLVVVGNQFGIKINRTNIKKPALAKINQQSSIPQQVSQPVNEQNLEQNDVGALPENANQPDHFIQPDDSDDVLDQELEDIGISQKELDELEDLY